MTNPRTETWTIANGQTVSDAIYKQHLDLVGLVLPTLTGANVSFQGSQDGVNYAAISYEGSAVSFAKAGGNHITCHDKWFRGIPYVKIVSDASEGAERSISPIFYDPK